MAAGTAHPPRTRRNGLTHAHESASLGNVGHPMHDIGRIRRVLGRWAAKGGVQVRRGCGWCDSGVGEAGSILDGAFGDGTEKVEILHRRNLTPAFRVDEPTPAV